MTRRDLSHYAQIVAIVVVLGLVLGAVEAGPAYRATAATDKPERTAHYLLTRPAWEDPWENEKIEAALVAQGYFREDVPLSYELQDALHTACEAYGAPYDLALAVMEHESGFDAWAVGWDGHDIGLFQLRDSNHAWLKEETGADPLTPEGNIVCGVWYLAYLYDYCGGWPAALTCWRWGPGNGADSAYARAVLAAAEQWGPVLR